MDNLDNFLKLYFNIREEDIKTISHLFEIENLKKNDFYIEEGKICNKFSFIKHGALRLYSLADGKEITQWIATDNYFVTDLNSFTFAASCRWNIQCLTDVTLYTITKKNYAQLSSLIENWHILEKQFIIHCFTAMENRIFGHLSQTAQERYKEFFNENKDLLNKLPLHYIASMLGMSAETLSRIRSNQTS